MRKLLRRLQTLIPTASPRFTLISGAPRTGTSPVCTWVGKQAGVAAFYESRITVAAFEFYRQVESFEVLSRRGPELLTELRQLVFKSYAHQRLLLGRCVVEKEPLEPVAFPRKDYAEYLNFMEQLFPSLQMVFMQRDPLHTVWSMINRPWGKSRVDRKQSYLTIEEACEIWVANAHLIESRSGRSNVFVLRYEDLLADPDKKLLELTRFLGIKMGVPLVVKRPREIGFSAEEHDKVLQLTARKCGVLGACN